MKLHSIGMVGFKTFAERTKIIFNDELTAVVGPNGCGKSNVIDAIRWVLGESRSLQLRTEQSADVIFKGAATRAPLAYASVTLYFHDCLGYLSGEWSKFPEINITRKIDREGTSTYQINNTGCRRSDILTLFSGTGLGTSAYAIIGQGMIAKMIDAKPEVLRQAIEEASGVGQYKEKRRQTLKKIVQSTENSERLQNLIDELDSQLQHISKQAEIATRYKKIKEHVRDLRMQCLRHEWQCAADKHGSDTRELLGIDEKINTLNVVCAISHKKHEKIEGLLQNLNSKNEKNQMLYNRVSQKLGKHEEAKKSFELISARLNKELLQGKQALTQQQASFQSAQSEYEALVQDSSRFNEVCNTLNDKIKDIKKNVAKAKKNQMMAEKRHQKALESYDAAKEISQDWESKKRWLEEEKTAVWTQLNVANAQCDSTDFGEIKKKYREGKAACEDLKARLSATKSDLNAINQVIVEAKTRHQSSLRNAQLIKYKSIKINAEKSVLDAIDECCVLEDCACLNAPELACTSYRNERKHTLSDWATQFNKKKPLIHLKEKISRKQLLILEERQALLAQKIETLQHDLYEAQCAFMASQAEESHQTILFEMASEKRDEQEKKFKSNAHANQSHAQQFESIEDKMAISTSQKEDAHQDAKRAKQVVDILFARLLDHEKKHHQHGAELKFLAQRMSFLEAQLAGHSKNIELNINKNNSIEDESENIINKKSHSHDKYELILIRQELLERVFHARKKKIIILNQDIGSQIRSLNSDNKSREGFNERKHAIMLSLQRSSDKQKHLIANAESLIGAPVVWELNESNRIDNYASIQKKIDTLSQHLKRMGPVNLAAIDEVSHLNERHAYLLSQQQDLNSALSTLNQAIHDIDHETKQKFKEAYAHVSQNFSHLFSLLFKGGKASLNLIGSDMLEAGIGIEAQPAGKKCASIHLLSGGEKTLTAVALLFALFSYRPAPFCLLDEVDAALDDQNIQKFSSLLKQMAKRLQIMVISHHKHTLSVANQLIGITMREAGVSRQVSVNIDQALKMAEKRS